MEDHFIVLLHPFFPKTENIVYNSVPLPPDSSYTCPREFLSAQMPHLLTQYCLYRFPHPLPPFTAIMKSFSYPLIFHKSSTSLPPSYHYLIQTAIISLLFLYNKLLTDVPASRKVSILSPKSTGKKHRSDPCHIKILPLAGKCPKGKYTFWNIT